MTDTASETIGDRILTELRRDFYFEQDSWATEAVARVASRLQLCRTGKEPLTVHVPWLDELTAFTSAGSHIFVSRKLIQLLPKDDHIAFVIAHEMAHHDCGHLDLLPDWFAALSPVEVRSLIFALYRVTETLINGAQTEMEADLYAFKMVDAAGYDVDESLRLFDILAKAALDLGSVKLVWGLDAEFSQGINNRIVHWLSQRRSGYLSITERKNVLVKLLAESKLAKATL